MGKNSWFGLTLSTVAAVTVAIVVVDVADLGAPARFGVVAGIVVGLSTAVSAGWLLWERYRWRGKALTAALEDGAGISELSAIGLRRTFSSLSESKAAIREATRDSSRVWILGVRATVFVGHSNDAIIPDSMEHFRRLRDIRVFCLSPDSEWISVFARQGRVGSLDESTIRKDLRASHDHVSRIIAKLIADESQMNDECGFYYYDSLPPVFRVILTDTACFVASYATNSQQQVDSQSVAEIVAGSTWYGAFERFLEHIPAVKVLGPNVESGERVTISAGGILLTQVEGIAHVALLKRHDSDAWVIPKGHVLPGETAQDAAAREIAEELQLETDTFSIARLVDTYEEFEAARKFGESKAVHVFLAECIAPHRVSPSSEHAEARWWNATGPLPKMAHPEQGRIIREVGEAMSK